MTKSLSFLLFVTIISTVYFGLHYYVYKRLWSGLDLSAETLRYIRILFWVGGVSFLAGEIIRRQVNISFLFIIGVIWMGLIAISFSVTLLKDLGQWLTPIPPRLLGYGALVLIMTITGYSLFNGARLPRTREFTLSSPLIPYGQPELRLVQLSDLHLDGIKSVSWLEEIVTRVNAHQPDLIAITGDLIDLSIEKMRHYLPALQRLKARLGIFVVPGNHEYYSGLENYLECIKVCAMHEISNQVVSVTPFLQIAGLPDPTGKQFGRYQPQVNETLSRLDPAAMSILLSHQPLFFKEAAKHGVTLQLSGHTHAGQIPPMELIVRLVFRHAYGLGRRANSYIYTTCGTGTWGPPMRFLSRSEIVLFNIKPGPLNLEARH
ncbi:metallophosphoesterase [bacterium]|nr:metallophosphoesterase [bacterium]